MINSRSGTIAVTVSGMKNGQMIMDTCTIEFTPYMDNGEQRVKSRIVDSPFVNPNGVKIKCTVVDTENNTTPIISVTSA